MTTGTRQLEGSEPFIGAAGTVADFWRFALPDLRVNNARGYLAEYLVARAIGATGPRTEWDSYDVLAPDGTRIEVKAAGYIQAWPQQQPSRIIFSGLRSAQWNTATGRADHRSFNADVYVFCHHTATQPDYNPTDISWWRFHALPAHVLERLNQDSIGLARLTALAGPSRTYVDLAGLIASCSSPGQS